MFYSGIVKTVLPDRPAYHPCHSCVTVGVLCACATCPMCIAVSLSLCDSLKIHIFHFVFVVLICTPHYTVNAHTIHHMMCLSTVAVSQCHTVSIGENTKEQETIIFTLFTLRGDLLYEIVIAVCPETVIFCGDTEAHHRIKAHMYDVSTARPLVVLRPDCEQRRHTLGLPSIFTSL